ncbi:hypothetical protein HYH03_013301 [Edaphochlamys debaryana]|uniref:Uncharacterized protein n=1 Tax=Edaphochlamys debaryana TaxID=47281 RepID=A0A836BUM9_9CHLO|nr:hypothetical protein HYH03_013301 [Edaphochlamys debaryana]|eukprot:KAG2488158.1 hypothetical protein HYH03_013301 [Edaphochlamys debaryana]
MLCTAPLRAVPYGPSASLRCRAPPSLARYARAAAAPRPRPSARARPSAVRRVAAAAGVANLGPVEAAGRSDTRARRSPLEPVAQAVAQAQLDALLGSRAEGESLRRQLGEQQRLFDNQREEMSEQLSKLFEQLADVLIQRNDRAAEVEERLEAQELELERARARIAELELRAPDQQRLVPDQAEEVRRAGAQAAAAEVVRMLRRNVRNGELQSDAFFVLAEEQATAARDLAGVTVGGLRVCLLEDACIGRREGADESSLEGLVFFTRMTREGEVVGQQPRDPYLQLVARSRDEVLEALRPLLGEAATAVWLLDRPLYAELKKDYYWAPCVDAPVPVLLIQPRVRGSSEPAGDEQPHAAHSAGASPEVRAAAEAAMDLILRRLHTSDTSYLVFEGRHPGSGPDITPGLKPWRLTGAKLRLDSVSFNSGESATGVAPGDWHPRSAALRPAEEDRAALLAELRARMGPSPEMEWLVTDLWHNGWGAHYKARLIPILRPGAGGAAGEPGGRKPRPAAAEGGAEEPSADAPVAAQASAQVLTAAEAKAASLRAQLAELQGALGEQLRWRTGQAAPEQQQRMLTSEELGRTAEQALALGLRLQQLESELAGAAEGVSKVEGEEEVEQQVNPPPSSALRKQGGPAHAAARSVVRLLLRHLHTRELPPASYLAIDLAAPSGGGEEEGAGRSEEGPLRVWALEHAQEAGGRVSYDWAVDQDGLRGPPDASYSLLLSEPARAAVLDALVPLLGEGMGAEWLVDCKLVDRIAGRGGGGDGLRGAAVAAEGQRARRGSGVTAAVLKISTGANPSEGKDLPFLAAHAARQRAARGAAEAISRLLSSRLLPGGGCYLVLGEEEEEGVGLEEGATPGLHVWLLEGAVCNDNMVSCIGVDSLTPGAAAGAAGGGKALLPACPESLRLLEPSRGAVLAELRPLLGRRGLGAEWLPGCCTVAVAGQGRVKDLEEGRSTTRLMSVVASAKAAGSASAPPERRADTLDDLLASTPVKARAARQATAQRAVEAAVQLFVKEQLPKLQDFSRIHTQGVPQAPDAFYLVFEEAAGLDGAPAGLVPWLVEGGGRIDYSRHYGMYVLYANGLVGPPDRVDTRPEESSLKLLEESQQAVLEAMQPLLGPKAQATWRTVVLQAGSGYSVKSPVLAISMRWERERYNDADEPAAGPLQLAGPAGRSKLSVTLRNFRAGAEAQRLAAARSAAESVERLMLLQLTEGLGMISEVELGQSYLTDLDDLLDPTRQALQDALLRRLGPELGLHWTRRMTLAPPTNLPSVRLLCVTLNNREILY